MKSKNYLKTYWILAYPAKHSLSPLIHNCWFENLNINAKYEIFEIEPVNLDNFIIKLKNREIEWLSVSMPYKNEIIKYLDEIDWISKKLNSVNTVYWKKWKLCGTNTDIDWVLLPILKVLKLDNPLSLENSDKELSIAILWAGWAASAACYATKQISNNVTLFNRTIEKAINLWKIFWIKAKKLEDFKSENFDIIIQMTSVWMWKNSNEIILPYINFNKNQIVFESIYNPLETQFVKKAVYWGAKVITWDQMLLAQASKQFKIWTWKSLDLQKVKERLW